MRKLLIILILFPVLFFSCKKEITEEIIILDDGKHFEKIIIKKIYSKTFDMEIQVIPFKNGFIVGEQKGIRGFVTKFDFKGNQLLRTEIEFGKTPDKMMYIYGCFFDEEREKIYNIAYPYIKIFSPDSLNVKTLFRLDHRSSKLGNAYYMYPPVIQNYKNNYIFRFSDKLGSSKKKRSFGIGIVNKDFKNFKILKQFYKKFDMESMRLMKKKIFPINYYYDKENEYFPICNSSENNSFFIQDIWAPILSRISREGVEKRYILKVKKRKFSKTALDSLLDYSEWYKGEVISGLLKGYYKKVRVKRFSYFPYFENVFIYKNYLLLFSGTRDWKNNKTSVYVFDKENMNYLGRTIFPYSGDNYCMVFYKSFFTNVSLKKDKTGAFFFELVVYRLIDKC